MEYRFLKVNADREGIVFLTILVIKGALMAKRRLVP